MTASAMTFGRGELRCVANAYTKQTRIVIDKADGRERERERAALWSTAASANVGEGLGSMDITRQRQPSGGAACDDPRRLARAMGSSRIFSSACCARPEAETGDGFEKSDRRGDCGNFGRVTLGEVGSLPLDATAFFVGS